ncbi:hypothetical protein CEXT_468671 [Caerostris extrusa]|uniref:Uncharacterized protein n=1 Tax=Caerostris extrusa TaxID=172846 RepID=A0AAV4U154_CAEEX|nr:hypothetical protein CEXT_468671 [Caerostris extrusa]
MDFAFLPPQVTGERKKITKSLLTSKITFKDLAPTSKARSKGNWNSLFYLRYETKFDGTQYLKRVQSNAETIYPKIFNSHQQHASILSGQIPSIFSYGTRVPSFLFFFLYWCYFFQFTIPFSIDVTPSKTSPMLQYSPPDRKMSIVNKEEGPWLRYSKKKRI